MIQFSLHSPDNLKHLLSNYTLPISLISRRFFSLTHHYQAWTIHEVEWEKRELFFITEQKSQHHPKWILFSIEKQILFLEQFYWPHHMQWRHSFDDGYLTHHLAVDLVALIERPPLFFYSLPSSSVDASQIVIIIGLQRPV